eukprot:3068874-Pyramimonas_sp.AAC.1
MGQGISETRVARMSQAKVARSPHVKTCRPPDCRRRLTRNRPDAPAPGDERRPRHSCTSRTCPAQ